MREIANSFNVLHFFFHSASHTYCYICHRAANFVTGALLSLLVTFIDKSVGPYLHARYRSFTDAFIPARSQSPPQQCHTSQSYTTLLHRLSSPRPIRSHVYLVSVCQSRSAKSPHLRVSNPLALLRNPPSLSNRYHHLGNSLPFPRQTIIPWAI
jgi:hypothetical protein